MKNTDIVNTQNMLKMFFKLPINQQIIMIRALNTEDLINLSKRCNGALYYKLEKRG